MIQRAPAYFGAIQNAINLSMDHSDIDQDQKVLPEGLQYHRIPINQGIYGSCTFGPLGRESGGLFIYQIQDTEPILRPRAFPATEISAS